MKSNVIIEGRYSRWNILVWFLGLVLLLGLGEFSFAFGEASKEFSLVGTYVQEGEFCYVASLPKLSRESDSPEAPERSTLLLYENGKPLGPPHALHEGIRKIGKGAFSHWGEILYFSASDNSNPNTNGRAYTVKMPASLNLNQPRLWPALAGLLILLLAMGWSLSRGPRENKYFGGVLALLSLIPLWLWHKEGANHHQYYFLIYLTVLGLVFWLGVVGARGPLQATSPREKARNGLAWAVLTLNLIVLILGFFQLNGAMPLLTNETSLEKFFPLQGRAWTAPIPIYLPSHMEGASRVVLKEDGKPLPMPNALHADIWEKGQGRYSHWGRSIIFAASDNTSPNTSGHSYTITYPEWFPWYWMGAAFWQALLLVGIRHWRRFTCRRLLVSLAVALLAVLAIYSSLSSTVDLINFLAIHLNAFIFYCGLMLVAISLPLLGFRVNPAKLSPWAAVARGIIMLMALWAGTNLIEANYWWTTVQFPRTIPLALHKLLTTATLFSLAVIYLLWVVTTLQIPRLMRHAQAFKLLYRLKGSIDTLATLIAKVVDDPRKTGAVLIILVLSSRLLFSFCQVAHIPQYDNSYYDYWGQFLMLNHYLPTEYETVPFYAFFLAFVYWSLGHSFLAVEIINVILSLLGVYALYRAAYLGCRSYLGAFVTGLLAAVFEWQYLFVYTTQIESFFIPLCMVLLYFLLLFWMQPSAWTVLLVGLAGAVLYMTRIQGLAFLGTSLLFVLLVHVPWRKRILFLLIWLTPILLSISAWSWYNLTHEYKAVMSSNQASTRFSLHNSPLAKSGLPHVQELAEIGAYLKKKYPPPKIWWEEGNREALEFYRNNPKVLFKRLVQRGLAVLNWVPVSFFQGLPQDFWRDQKDLWMWNREIVILLALSLVGLVKNRRRLLPWMLLSLFIMGVVSLLPFSTPDPRPRWPFDSALFLLAGFACCRLARNQENDPIKVVRPRSVLLATAALLGVGVLLHIMIGRHNLTQRWFPLEAGMVKYGEDVCQGFGVDKDVLIISPAQIRPQHIGKMLITAIPLSNRWSDVPAMKLGQYLLQRYDIYSVSNRFYTRSPRYSYTIDIKKPITVCSQKDLREHDWVVAYCRLEGVDIYPWYLSFRVKLEAILDNITGIEGFNPEADEAKLPYSPPWRTPRQD